MPGLVLLALVATSKTLDPGAPPAADAAKDTRGETCGPEGTGSRGRAAERHRLADKAKWVWAAPEIVELSPTTESATISTLMVIQRRSLE